MVFNNMYEMITPPSVIKKSWFVDYFSGDALNSWWSIGAGSLAAEDAVNGGIKFTGAGNNWIIFGGKRHFEPTGMVVEAIMTAADLTSLTFVVGSTNTGGLTSQMLQVGIKDATSATFFSIQLRNGGTSGTATSISEDLNVHRHRAELNATAGLYSLDGILEATHTSNRPTAKQQPLWFAQADQSGATISYIEVYNT